jgi:hypothetical protein
MIRDIENVNFEDLDEVGQLEYAQILMTNLDQTILQLESAKETNLASILNTASRLRLSDRHDLLIRFAHFGDELIRTALIDKRREFLQAQTIIRALENQREHLTQEKPTSDIPVEPGQTNSPVINGEGDSEN